ncbi:MAG TPA: DUF1223 domain-containing protein [Xanthobacteraceae bacterium]|nr:DUF1223 domain-containing protein [Xanthobacteraceae bacterium]
MTRLCARIVLPLLMLASSAPGAALAEPRGMIELFTSQGCSSCPPADKLIAELARDDSLVVISLPIDYWDYLGWKDTLARPRHTARQRGYASVRGDREVYTPQAVINGIVHVVGSDRNAIEDAIARTRGHAAALTVPIHASLVGGELKVEIKPAKKAESVAEVWLCTIAKAIPVAIKRGENRGRTITYHNVVRKWIKLGVWNGGEQNWTVPPSELQSEEADLVAVLLQTGSIENPGAVLGAATAPLR